MHLTQKQKQMLMNILNKNDDWNSDYDNLFIDIIPFTYRVIINNTKFANTLLLENDDFLSNAFISYTKTIEKYWNHQLPIDNFLTTYNNILRDNLRSQWKKHSKNGQKILNYYHEYENILENDITTNNSLFCDKLYKALLTDNFMRNFVNLRAQGKDIDEIIRIMNLSKSTFYNKLNSSRNKIRNELI